MAKKSRRKPKKAGSDDRASRAAAVRWYLLKIEVRALELVLSHADNYGAVADVLRGARRALDRIKPAPIRFAAGCEPPWRRCEDNVCRPECDIERFG